MLSNLRHSLTIEEMARSVNLSESHLQQLFKSEIGLSPIQYLKHLQLEKSRELLEDSFLQIWKIEYMVGMPDQSHFIHDFKQKYGTTPTDYRKKHSEKTQAEESDANES